MKKLILVLAISMFFGFQSFSQIDLDNEMMKGSTLITMPGQILVYEVDYYGITYDFIVNVKSLTDGIEFDYEMTNADSTKGTVKMSKEAFEDAVAQSNYFSGGLMDLTDKTTVWVSKKVFNDLVNTGKATISPDGGGSYVEIANPAAGHNYEMYNAISDRTFDDISYVYAESPDGSVRYWIHMSKYNPLILKMDLGWTITLKELRKE